MKIETINEKFGAFAEVLLRMRWWTLAAFAVVVVLSLMGVKKLVVRTSFDDYFIEGDPMLVKTDEFKAHFGNDNFVGVLTECDNHFTSKNLEALRTFSNELLDSLSYVQDYVAHRHRVPRGRRGGHDNRTDCARGDSARPRGLRRREATGIQQARNGSQAHFQRRQALMDCSQAAPLPRRLGMEEGNDRSSRHPYRS